MSTSVVPIMTYKTSSRFFGIRVVVVLTLVSLQFPAADAVATSLGNMKADSILFLGNSITACPQAAGADWWGLSASTPEKDYAHLLTNKINTTAGTSLALDTADMDRWYYNNALPNWTGNVLNIADLFERNFNTWDNARIQNQIAAKPDIVILQFGENMEGGTTEQFRTAFDTLLTTLKNNSNPHIFVTSYIIDGSYATAERTKVDNIKKDLCEEDPTHRVYIDLNDIWKHSVNIGAYNHPSDAGMAAIADSVFTAMQTHAVPEPSSAAMSLVAVLAACLYGCKRFGRTHGTLRI